MDILITEDLDAPAIHRLMEKFDVVRDATLCKDKLKFMGALRDARSVMIRNLTQMTADHLAAAPRLLGIGRLGVGLDNIDLPAASKRGVVVIAPLNANATSVAELTMGLIIALARKIPLSDRSTKAGGWDRQGCTGLELDGTTLAICGFGRIGKALAARARPFGLRVRVFDPFVNADSPALHESGATLCSGLEVALAGADFVTTHTPLTPDTHRLFNARTFAAMKRGAFFINTSRGGVVDETALLDALQSGHLGGAALDVREIEPPGQGDVFVALDNVILTPHIGSFTHEAQTRTFEAVADDLERLLRGEPVVNFVNFALPRSE